jgi:hypothetical protein
MGDTDTAAEPLTDLAWIRRRDPHGLRHHQLRQTVAFTVDAALHLGFALVVWRWFATTLPDANFWWQVEVAIGAYALVSYAHRALLQRLVGTTIGKALVGMCVILNDTRGRPSLFDLSRQWFMGYAAIILFMPSSLIIALSTWGQ